MRQKVAIPLGFIGGGSTYHNFIGGNETLQITEGFVGSAIEQDTINNKKLTIQGIVGKRLTSYRNSLKVKIYFDGVLREAIVLSADSTVINTFVDNNIYEYDLTNVNMVRVEFGCFNSASSSKGTVTIREIKFE